MVEIEDASRSKLRGRWWRWEFGAALPHLADLNLPPPPPLPLPLPISRKFDAGTNSPHLVEPSTANFRYNMSLTAAQPFRMHPTTSTIGHTVSSIYDGKSTGCRIPADKQVKVLTVVNNWKRRRWLTELGEFLRVWRRLPGFLCTPHRISYLFF
jgi:hypothetical protein